MQQSKGGEVEEKEGSSGKGEKPMHLAPELTYAKSSAQFMLASVATTNLDYPSTEYNPFVAPLVYAICFMSNISPIPASVMIYACILEKNNHLSTQILSPITWYSHPGPRNRTLRILLHKLRYFLHKSDPEIHFHNLILQESQVNRAERCQS